MSPDTFSRILNKLKKYNSTSEKNLEKYFSEELEKMETSSLSELIEHLTISIYNTPEWAFRKLIIKKIIKENEKNPNTLMKLSLILSRSGSTGLLDLEHVSRIRQIISDLTPVDSLQ